MTLNIIIDLTFRGSHTSVAQVVCQESCCSQWCQLIWGLCGQHMKRSMTSMPALPPICFVVHNELSRPSRKLTSEPIKEDVFSNYSPSNIPQCRYGMLHLHPLRSRVRDMEHKLKVAMDNLIRGVKLASSQRSPPGN